MEFSALFKMGARSSKSKGTDLRVNIKIYKEWEGTNSDVTEELRKTLCMAQYGKELERVKILWFRASPDHIIPILVREEDSLEFLERIILPEARRIYQKGLRVHRVSLLGEFTKENFYDKIDESTVTRGTDLKGKRKVFCL